MRHRLPVSALLALSIPLMIILAPASAEDDLESARLIREKIREGMSIREGELAKAREMGMPIKGEMPGGGLFELKTISTRVPTYFITHNEAAARSTRADSVHAVYGGAPGVTLGIWDGGAARVTHVEMAGRATWRDSYSYSTHPHSTHVGATMIGSGVDPLAKGMSYEADLISYEWSFDDLEAEHEAQYGLTLSNHSYGHGRGWVAYSSGSVYWYGDVEVSETEDHLFGFYSETARDWDRVADENGGYLPVTSAGNDRNDAVPPGTTHYYWNPLSGGWVQSTATRENDGGELGYDCIPDGLSTAKNTLVIGAVLDVEDYQGPESVELTEFSSWGPTDDGRIKPDICGNGYRLYSAIDGSDEAYGIYSGTSMAAPNVCGSLGLLQQKYFDMHSRYLLGATVKALAIATAREAGPHPGPDYGFGWGLLDTWAAYEVIESDSTGRKGSIVEMWLYDGRPVEFYYTPEDGAERMTFTVAWADPPAEVPPPALNDRTPVLVDDIDLRVIGTGGEYLPWVLDPDDPQAPAARGDNLRDNVEQIVIDNPGPGTYRVAIDHKGRLRDGTQYVSMVVTGAARTRTWHIYADGSGDAPTIREAVELAEPGDHILVFGSYQTGGTYNEHDIVIDKPLLIRGINRPGLTSGNAGRFFHVVQPEGAPRVTVDIENLRFLDCAAGDVVSGEMGGAISCEGTRVNITACIFEDCSAARGGAVYIDGESVTMNSCTFEDCMAAEGGAVYLRESRSVLENCILHDNEAEEGGGVFMLRSDAILRGSTMTGNRADRGGALFLETSSPDIINCTLAYNFRGPGSGIYVKGGGRPRVVRSIVAFGNGSLATGIHSENLSSNPSVVCCDVYGNEFSNYGGSMTDLTGIQGNISEDPMFCGQDVYGRYDSTVGDGSPCMPNRNDCLTLIGAHGAGCHTLTKMRITPDGTGDVATISDAMLIAERGDTIILAPGVFAGPGNRDISTRGSQVVITSEAGAGETIIDCFEGGGSYYGFYFGSGEDTTTVLEGVTVKGAGDGAVICSDGSSPLIRDCRFIESRGGGIAVETNSSPVVRRCVFLGNSNSPNGGGANIRNSAPVFEDCEFTGNTAIDNGGAIACGSSSNPVIRRCIISGNRATTDSGGGVYSIMGEITLEDCVISGNTADYGGGGIFSGTSSTVRVTGTLISGNSSTTIGGGVYSAIGMTMSRCTVVDNYTEYYGAGIEVFQGPNNYIDNSIIAFNRNAEGIFSISGDIDIVCSDVYGNEGGNYGGSTADMTGPLNLSLDPLFCDTAGGDWYLNADSPVLTPPDPSCGEMMGALGVRCGDSADLLFSSVVFDTMSADAGRTIHAAAMVRNNGPAGAGSFRVDFYSDLDDPPVPGEEGDWYQAVDTLASGDSTSATFDISSQTAGMWRSWLMIDTGGQVPEYNIDNNTAGPFTVTWNNPGGIVPEQSRLREVSPNPFGDETEIVYDLDRRAAVELTIFDLSGRRLMSWNFPPAGPGRFFITWPGTTVFGRQVASGVYFLKLKVDGVVEQSEKIVRVR